MLRFCDGFDHYAYTKVTYKWTQILLSTNGDISDIIAGGRNSTNGLNLKTTAGNDHTDRLCKVVPTSGTTCVVGFAFKCINAFTAFQASSIESVNTNNAATLLSIRQGGTTQVWFAINTSGQILCYRGTTLLGTSSGGLSQGTFHYLEFKVVVDNTAGTVEVKRDGTSILSLTSQDTQNTASATWDEICIGTFGADTAQVDVIYDDLIVMDGSGSYNNNLLGDRRIQTLYPNAVGNSNQSTPSGGAVDRYTMVDETAINDDTDYNTFATTGDKDTYGAQNCGISGSPVSAVAVNMTCRKADAGEAGIATVARISAVDYDSNTHGCPSSYGVAQHIWERSPVDGTTAWTTAVIDGAEFGAKKAS